MPGSELMNLQVAQNLCCATAVRKASRRLTQLYDAALAPCGLRCTQLSILTELERRADIAPTINELAEALVMDRSSLGHNLRPLERDGLLVYEPCARDRRTRLVSLTRKGKLRVIEARRLWLKAQKHFHKTFGVARSAELRETMLSIAYDDRLASVAT